MRYAFWGPLRRPNLRGGKVLLFSIFATMLAAATIALGLGATSAGAASGFVGSRNSATGVVSGTMTVTGIKSSDPAQNNANGFYQGSIQLYYGSTMAGGGPSTTSDANGDVTISYSFTPPCGDTSAQLELESLTRAGGVDQMETVTFPTCTTSTSPSPAQKPTVTLHESQTSVTLGQSTILSWTSTNATSLSASGDWHGSQIVPSGSYTVTPPSAGSYTYTLTASGAGGTANTSVTLVVNPKPTPPVSTSPTHVKSTPPAKTVSPSKSNVVAPPAGNYQPPSAAAHTGQTGLPLWVYGIAALGLLGLGTLLTRRVLGHHSH